MKIAILGCENSHANAFLKQLRDDPAYGSIEVTGVYSDETEAAEKLAAEFGVSVAESYGDFAGKVDGVIITARHGDNHYKYAKPYIESGIPMFIDKPITVSEEEAVTFMKELKEHGVRISGGSSCVHAEGVNRVREAIASGEKGEVLGGFVRAPISMENNYGGFFFYAQHAVEVACSLFGYYPRSVRAYQNGKKYTFSRLKNSPAGGILIYDIVK